MIWTIRNRWALRLLWRRWKVPSYVTAHRRLWLFWVIRWPVDP